MCSPMQKKTRNGDVSKRNMPTFQQSAMQKKMSENETPVFYLNLNTNRADSDPPILDVNIDAIEQPDAQGVVWKQQKQGQRRRRRNMDAIQGSCVDTSISGMSGVAPPARIQKSNIYVFRLSPSVTPDM